ncbi:MAG: ribulose-phosphate 3-epimerase [Puniceicoccales bacterium]|jgi:ribulose-phosphate 3-epimerase|nr:ribulose-phosphate 3-epimerase [Puniceicoccales bacterium]
MRSTQDKKSVIQEKSPRGTIITPRSAIQKLSSPLLIPSLLSGDQGDLRSSQKIIELHQLPWVHMDIMDGHFVSNLSFGAQTLKALKKGSSLLFDVHLMLEHPEIFLESFIEAGADLISFHIESQGTSRDMLQYVREENVLVGLACDLGTSPERLVPWLEQVDVVLLMAVQAGFCGQSFNPDVLMKIDRIGKLRRQHKLPFFIAVDGGINVTTAQDCLQHGADLLVSGSSFFDPAQREALRKLFPLHV